MLFYPLFEKRKTYIVLSCKSQPLQQDFSSVSNSKQPNMAAHGAPPFKQLVPFFIYWLVYWWVVLLLYGDLTPLDLQQNASLHKAFNIWSIINHSNHHFLHTSCLFLTPHLKYDTFFSVRLRRINVRLSALIRTTSIFEKNYVWGRDKKKKSTAFNIRVCIQWQGGRQKWCSSKLF